ncbi:hypothetical protein FHT82_002463 [Rhizobium sp. BK275]|uniref:MbcA/ParS/Xre antitoxin family protein n=1 Tax=Rhizobium sp. BK275 TaxID=2587077 RepID=UPI0016208ED5|nr:MbcA/ParS/Xre antitoxin family protein [Rhizobium sp. BK275]MBB3389723.1 hypothetical protein [Rhizobium sp. BK275]
MATKATIADLFPDDEGMILVAKYVSDGSPRRITEVANGGNCGCVCFGCDRRLIARNGGDPTVRAYSFAHRPEDNVVDCVSSGETALHIRAKEIIAKHCRITLPTTSTPGLDGKPIEVSPERSIQLTDVHLETAAGEVIPDVIATMPDGRRLFIEIANTHPCPPEKIEKLDAMGVEVLEITVSSYQSHPLDELDDIILDIAPRKLIHSAEVKAMAAKIAEERQRQESEKIAEAKRLVAVYRDPEIWNHKKAQKLVDDLVQLDLSEFLDLDDDRPSAFVVYRRQWQAAIFDRLSKTKSALGAMDFISSFSKGDWPKKDIAYTKSDYSRWIAANVDEDFKSPYEEVFAYLRRLRRAGAVYEVPVKRFVMGHDIQAVIDTAIQKRTLPERQSKQLRVAFHGVGSLMLPEDGGLPDYDVWLQSRAEYFDLSVEELLADEDGDYEELLDQVIAVRTMIEDMQRLKDVDPPDEMAGLPMGRLINRLGLARLEAEERAEAELAARREREVIERAARLEQEAADRVQKAEEAALFDVDDVAVFMKTPLPEHGGKTPGELAAESSDGLKQVQAILWRIRDDKVTAERAERARRAMVDKLCDRVYSRNLRRDVADLWLTAQCKELGWIKPVDYCRDEKTLARCLEVLEEFAANERKRRRR